MEPIWAGVDLGGTGTRVVIVDSSGTVLASEIQSTRRVAGNNPNEAVANLSAILRELSQGTGEFSGVGIGASGPVDLHTGVILNPDTLPYFSEIDISSLISREFGVPVWIDNDAVVAGLAEATWESGPHEELLMCVTLGTGIGVSYIKDGIPLRGGDGQHPEGGHIGVPGVGHPCYCGIENCWEQVASRTILDGLLLAHFPSMIDSQSEFWAEYARGLAAGLKTHLAIHRPSAIAIAGSVTGRWLEFCGPLLKEMYMEGPYPNSIRIYPSRLGEFAGARGASLLPRMQIGWQSFVS